MSSTIRIEYENDTVVERELRSDASLLHLAGTGILDDLIDLLEPPASPEGSNERGSEGEGAPTVA